MRTTSDSDLTGAIYDAAIDTEAWHCLPDLLRRRLDADSVVLWYRESDGVFTGTIANVDPVAMDLYGARYGSIDPWGASAQRTGRLGDALLGSDLVPEREFRQTEFYTDFARHYETNQMVGAGRQLPKGVMMAVAAHRPFHVSPFNKEHCAALEMLFPHLQRLVRLRIELAARERPHVSETILGSASLALAVCSADCKVMYANRAADAAAEEFGLVLGAGCGQICAARRRDTVELRTAITSAATRGASSAVSLEAPRGERIFIMVTPLEGGPGIGHRALLVVRSTSERSRLGYSTLVSLFGLTRAESEVIQLISSGLSMREVCAQRRVTENTGRTQLAIAMQKIGVANQRELVALLSRLSPLG